MIFHRLFQTIYYNFQAKNVNCKWTQELYVYIPIDDADDNQNVWESKHELVSTRKVFKPTVAKEMSQVQLCLHETFYYFPRIH